MRTISQQENQTLTITQWSELINFLKSEAYKFGENDFENELSYCNNHWWQNFNPKIDGSISFSDMVIDVVLEYHEALLPDHLKSVDLINLDQSIFDEEFRNELDGLIKKGYFESAKVYLKGKPEASKLYSEELLTKLLN